MEILFLLLLIDRLEQKLNLFRPFILIGALTHRGPYFQSTGLIAPFCASFCCESIHNDEEHLAANYCFSLKGHVSEALGNSLC